MTGEIKSSKIYKEIERIKSNLIKRAQTRGLYENFGEREARKLEDKHRDNWYQWCDNGQQVCEIVQSLSNWAGSYDGSRV